MPPYLAPLQQVGALRGWFPKPHHTRCTVHVCGLSLRETQEKGCGQRKESARCTTTTRDVVEFRHLAQLGHSTSFIYVYPIKNHGEFYDVAARHVKYVRSRHSVNIEKMSADYDPTWSSTNTRDFNPDTVAGLDFQSEYALELRRSPPHTQAAMNYAESVMGRIMAMANQQLITAHLAPKAFWWCAVRNAAIIHNLGPVESNRPLLQGDTTPFEAMTGRRADVSSITAPFGALCWIKVMSSLLLSTHGTKPSQLKPVSEPAIYLGTAEGAAGWTVLRLSQVGNARKTLTVTYHLTPILDMSARPTPTPVRSTRPSKS